MGLWGFFFGEVGERVVILLHLSLKPGYIAGEGDVRDGAQLIALNVTRRIHTYIGAVTAHPSMG